MKLISHLSEDIRSEFTIDEQGRAFASRRAVARLVGVEHPSILKLLKRIASKNWVGTSRSVKPSIYCQLTDAPIFYLN